MAATGGAREEGEDGQVQTQHGLHQGQECVGAEFQPSPGGNHAGHSSF